MSNYKKPYKDGRLLNYLYHNRKMTLEEVSNWCNCTRQTVTRWMEKFGIGRRGVGIDVSESLHADRKTLEKMYYEDRMTQEEIGDELGVSIDAIRWWMDKHGIEREMGRPVSGYIKYGHDDAGHPRWVDSGTTVYVHQLVAILDGADPNKVFCEGREIHTHHKNHIPFDNRPCNIEVLDASNHAKQHNLGNG